MDDVLSKTAPAGQTAIDQRPIEEAARILAQGGLVAFPTETVYGLGADATNGIAVARIFAAKGRPRFNPLIVHVANLAEAQRHAVFPAAARALAENFWPGALSLVLPCVPDCTLSPLVSAGLDTVALRVPAHAMAQALLAQARVPIAAPSANLSGRVSATRAHHAAGDLGAKIDFVLDGGPAPLGIESTVIGFDGDAPILLRPGAIARDAIEAVAGPIGIAGEAIRSPGQLASHYAPRAALRLDAREAREGEILIGFGPGAAEMNLSPRGDLAEAAANLFALLREADALGPRGIAVAPIPHKGLGEAINDRLARAAAPR